VAIILSAPQVSEKFSNRVQPGTSDGAKLFDFREELRRQKRKRVWTVSMLAAGGMLLGTAIGIVGINWSSFAASARETPRHTFAVCGLVRRTCVVDGDTIWLEGVKIRIADIDTPEISQPQCDAEYTRGIRARDRLVVLLNEGEFSLVAIGDRDEDQYGRKLRVIMRGGRSLGDQLVSEGLARTWTGRREPWC